MDTYRKSTYSAPAQLPLTFLVLIGLVVKIWSLVFSSTNALSKIPGPKIARYTRFWILRRAYSWSLAEQCANLYKTYGPVVRIGPNHVLISDPKDIRKVLAVGSSYTRGPWFDALKLHNDETNIVCERDPIRHQRKRSIYSAGAILTSLMLGNGMKTFEHTIDEHVRTWIEQIRKDYVPDRPAPYNVMTSFKYLAVDVVSHLTLGAPFGSLKARADVHRFIEVFNAGTKIQTSLSVLPELKSLLVMLSYVPILGKYLAPEPGDGSLTGTVLIAIQDPIRERMLGRSPNVEVLDSFIERGMTEREAIGDLLLIMSAGVETTTCALSAIIFFIVSTPGVQSRLKGEIKILLSMESTFTVQESTLKRSPYFQACIAEALRAYPPSFQLRERLAPPSGDTLSGFEIPPGTFIGFNSKAAQLHEVFGEDVEKYRPERWLGQSSERIAAMKRNLDLVWNHGSTKCLGMNIATMELEKCTFELFRNFQVSLDDSCKVYGTEVIPRKLLIRLTLEEKS